MALKCLGAQPYKLDLLGGFVKRIVSPLLSTFISTAPPSSVESSPLHSQNKFKLCYAKAITDPRTLKGMSLQVVSASVPMGFILPLLSCPPIEGGSGC